LEDLSKRVAASMMAEIVNSYNTLVTDEELIGKEIYASKTWTNYLNNQKQYKTQLATRKKSLGSFSLTQSASKKKKNGQLDSNVRGRSRWFANTCVGEQKENYFLGNTEDNCYFILLADVASLLGLSPNI